jgi:hypothetical protein
MHYETRLPPAMLSMLPKTRQIPQTVMRFG